jgi:FkbM family methyltransferase
MGVWELTGNYSTACVRMGIPAVVRIIRHKISNMFPVLRKTAGGQGSKGTVRLCGYPAPVRFRKGSSDLDVIAQIFIHNWYGPLGHDGNVRYIIDCGANCGYSTLYFLRAFPRATVIAVEPDPGNFRMLLENTAPFGARVTAVKKAVWSKTTPLKVCAGEAGDGREWATFVRDCRPSETPDAEGITVSRLMSDFGFPRIDVLKVDVEGAEREILKDGPLNFLNLTRSIAIELHNDEVKELFLKVMGNTPFRISSRGELTFALRKEA